MRMTTLSQVLYGLSLGSLPHGRLVIIDELYSRPSDAFHNRNDSPAHPEILQCKTQDYGGHRNLCSLVFHMLQHITLPRCDPLAHSGHARLHLDVSHRPHGNTKRECARPIGCCNAVDLSALAIPRIFGSRAVDEQTQKDCDRSTIVEMLRHAVDNM